MFVRVLPQDVALSTWVRQQGLSIRMLLIMQIYGQNTRIGISEQDLPYSRQELLACLYDLGCVTTRTNLTMECFCGI